MYMIVTFEYTSFYQEVNYFLHLSHSLTMKSCSTLFWSSSEMSSYSWPTAGESFTMQRTSSHLTQTLSSPPPPVIFPPEGGHNVDIHIFIIIVKYLAKVPFDFWLRPRTFYWKLIKSFIACPASTLVSTRLVNKWLQLIGGVNINNASPEYIPGYLPSDPTSGQSIVLGSFWNAGHPIIFF